MAADPYLGYCDWKPQTPTRALLEQVDDILNQYRKYWPLTCRQIFYRMVATCGYPKDELAYERLCTHLARARRAKRIPFHAIRDDGAAYISSGTYLDADEFLEEARSRANSYRRSVIGDQDIFCEVWCEAAGMQAQLSQVAKVYGIEVWSGGGYVSLTAKQSLANRICNAGTEAHILHLGDYDPSGVSIFENLRDDVTAFVMADRPHGCVTVQFHRVCLTLDQVEEYGLETSPPKPSDVRSRDWEGETCQLEALAPDTIADLLRDTIHGLLDEDELAETLELGRAERNRLVELLLPRPQGEGRAT